MQWSVLVDRAYDAGPLSASSDLRVADAKILEDTGLTGQFVVRRNPKGNIEAEQSRFLSAMDRNHEATLETPYWHFDGRCFAPSLSGGDDLLRSSAGRELQRGSARSDLLQPC
jgi:hypothetical protein